MGKNVAVFVDVANIFYAAKAAGVDIDYVTLLRSATAGRDLVRAYAYTGLDPDNENQRNFHDFLRRSNYKVVSKDIRKYGDGKVKANLDIELVVDMMKTARNLDIAIVVSGDGDFAPAIRAVQEQGVRVEVISFRGNTSSDLIEVADLFTDIVQLARVEKGSRSGRRVSEDDADLSMTEVPDKQTDGTGAGRGRGRGGRGRSRSSEAEPVVASSSRGRGRTRIVSDPVAATATGVVALPGERLARVPGSLTEADLAAAEVFTIGDIDASSDGTAPVTDGAGRGDDGEMEGEDGPRRRRRRGGRGRGRGRGRSEDTGEEVLSAAPQALPEDSPGDGSIQSAIDIEDDEDDEQVAAAPPRGPRTTPFGSVWDSQLGAPAATSTGRAPIVDDEDFDEPEIPEYLIAEQRRSGGRSGGGGARGGRSAYRSAMERERYGGGRSGGINRYPDVSARTGAPADRSRRDGGGQRRPDPSPVPRGSGEWSEVPPELEEQLRAQLAQAPVRVPRDGTPVPRDMQTSDVTETADAAGDAVETPAAKPKRASTRKPAAAKVAVSDAVPDAAPKAKPKRTSTRKTATSTPD